MMDKKAKRHHKSAMAYCDEADNYRRKNNYVAAAEIYLLAWRHEFEAIRIQAEISVCDKTFSVLEESAHEIFNNYKQMRMGI